MPRDAFTSYELYRFQPYISEKCPDLKAILKSRGLSVSGTKRVLINRLRDHDFAHPFPFFKLPSELRNKIYILISSHGCDRETADIITNEISRREKSQLAADTAPDIPLSATKFFATNTAKEIQPVALLRTCKQAFREGMPLFYQHHAFHFTLYSSRQLIPPSVMTWLQTLHRTLWDSIRLIFLETMANGLESVVEILKLLRHISVRTAVKFSSYITPVLDDLKQIGESLFKQGVTRAIFLRYVNEFSHQEKVYKIEDRATSTTRTIKTMTIPRRERSARLFIFPENATSLQDAKITDFT